MVSFYESIQCQGATPLAFNTVALVNDAGYVEQENMNRYEKHPSPKLQKLFQIKQYQGQDPKYSKVLMLGQDANYPRNMSDKLLNAIEEYHMNGVSFWETHGDEFHHPFLLDIFKGEVGGIRYHRQFRKLKLSSDYAKYISFVELLDEPTTGRTTDGNMDVFYSMVKQEYIERLNSWILSNGDKIVFVPQMVINKYVRKVHKKTKIMKWLIDCDCAIDLDEPKLIYDKAGIMVYKCYHFSGSITNNHIDKMSQIIKGYINGLKI